MQIFASGKVKVPDIEVDAEEKKSSQKAKETATKKDGLTPRRAKKEKVAKKEVKKTEEKVRESMTLSQK